MSALANSDIFDRSLIHLKKKINFLYEVLNGKAIVICQVELFRTFTDFHGHRLNIPCMLKEKAYCYLLYLYLKFPQTKVNLL